MFIHKNAIPLYISGLLLLMSSCQKREQEQYTPDTLKLSISKPVDAQVFQNGDTIFIAAEVSYSTEMHGYSIDLSSKDSRHNYLSIDEHVHDDHFSVKTYWIDTLTQAEDLMLTLTVEVDHDGNEKSQQVQIHSN